MAPLSARFSARPRLRSNHWPMVAAIGATLVAFQPGAISAYSTTSCHGAVTEGSSSSDPPVTARPHRNTVRGPKRPIASAMRGSSRAPST